MRALNLVSLVLVIVGGLNWGLVGLFDWDLVAAILGDRSIFARLVYVLVAASATWQLASLVGAINKNEPSAVRSDSA